MLVVPLIAAVVKAAGPVIATVGKVAVKAAVGAAINNAIKDMKKG